MKYSPDMFLESRSGYCFPFRVEEGDKVSVILDYGEQIHPKTGDKFFHTGLDFSVRNKPLYAIATGMVTGVGNNEAHENYIVTRYGNYFVSYGHILEAAKKYGDEVSAGDVIATAGDFLHFGVKFKGEDINPNDFVDLVYANMQQLAAIGEDPSKITEFRPEAKTEYDKYEKDIAPIMLRFFPQYLNDLHDGTYKPSPEFDNKLRELFSSTASQNYFYEQPPTIANPLGLSDRAAPLAARATDMIITDFLHYAAVKHNVFVPGWSAEQKKKLFRKAMSTMDR